jgi:sugar phosphate isomerase/epimerase
MILVSTSSLVNNSDVHDVMARYEAAGIKDIELGASHGPDVDISKIIEFKRRNSSTYTVHVFFPSDPDPYFVNIGSQDPLFLAKSMKAAKRAIDTAALVGAGIYGIHPGMMQDTDRNLRAVGPRYGREAVFLTMCQNLGQLVDYAAGKGITVALENMPENGIMTMTTLEDFRLVMKMVPGARFLIDIGHLARNMPLEKEGRAFIEELKARIAMFHVHRFDGKKDHLPLADANFISTLPLSLKKNTLFTLEGQGTWEISDIHSSIRILSEAVNS